MQPFEFTTTDISGLMKITPFIADDERGYFSKTFEKQIFADHGISIDVREELQSFSHKGVVRGLHFQREHSQDKLVRVLSGAVYDVAVDLRDGSETFGQWRGFTLTAEGREMLYLPQEFAHGFLALAENTLFSYLCGERYDPDSDGGIRWDDEELQVAWPLSEIDQVIVSEKDRMLPTFAEFREKYGSLPYGGNA